jgi:hypothetical protein
MVIFVSRFGVSIPSIVKIPVKIKLFAFLRHGTAIALGVRADSGATLAKAKSGSGDARLINNLG